MALCDLRLESAPSVPDSEQEVEKDLGWEVATAPDTGGMWEVFVHNDDVTPMDFVVAVLRSVFTLTTSDAMAVMLEAHYTGLSHVMTLPHEEAKYRVGKAHSLARAAGYPLTFSIEPE